MDNTSRKNPSNSIKMFWSWNINFRFQNNNLEFKYQFLDQISFLNWNNKFQNSNINFEIHYMNNIHTYAYWMYTHTHKMHTSKYTPMSL
jgi:hypothetical protein